jgi:cytochrome c553
MKKFILFLIVAFTAVFAREPQSIINDICSNCHGFNMEKKGFGVSQPPSSLSSSYIFEALTAYRAGKKSDYNMGETMTTQTSTLTDEEIKELSIYIKTLTNKKKK